MAFCVALGMGTQYSPKPSKTRTSSHLQTIHVFFSGIINDDDPKSTRQEIHVGAYVDDFVFYSTDPAEEEKSRRH